MLPEVLTDSDSSTLDDLLAVFDLPEPQNLDVLTQSVRFFLMNIIIGFSHLFLFFQQLLSQISTQNPYPSPPPSANIIPSPPPVTSHRPILLPKPSLVPGTNTISFPSQQQQITNCVKVQSYSGATSTGPKCVKIEPVINTTPPTIPPSNITIITTSKPITIAKLPMIKMPLTTSTTGNSTNGSTPITIVKTGTRNE